MPSDFVPGGFHRQLSWRMRVPRYPPRRAAIWPVVSLSTWAAMRSSARQPLQIWRVTSSRSRPCFQFTSSGAIPVAYSPSKRAAKRSRRTLTVLMGMSPSSMMRKPSRRKLSTCSSVTTPVPYPRVGDLREQSLEEFLDSVGEDTPAPGGGTSSAVTTALAAALVEMAARIGGESTNDSAGRAAELRGDALRLAEQELTS